MKVLRWLDEWAEEFCVSIMLSLLILLLGTEVFSRFLLSKSFSWIEELCGICLYGHPILASPSR